MSGAFPISNSKFSTMGIRSTQNTIISVTDSGKKLSRQIRLSPRLSVWRESEVLEWIAHH